MALALAGAGELLIESGDRTPLSLVLYLLGIGTFAISAWKLPTSANDTPIEDGSQELPKADGRRRVWAIMGAGVGIAILLNVQAMRIIQVQFDSPLGAYFWLSSLVVILATGVVLARFQGWSPRWGINVWPKTARDRLFVLAAVLTILLIAVIARFVALDSVPFGINADEGDRAATSIQIVRGYNKNGIFDAGWYWIGMIYFWLLAQFMKIVGIGFVQARMFGALAGVISVAVVTWLCTRHFNLRVGLLAGVLLSVLAVALQFSRETTEAGPTGTLWAISMALLLEGARRGRSYAWVGAGLAGGMSIYFYPTGRLWVVAAALFCVYLLVHGLGGRRLAIFRGCALTGIAALLTVTPFLAYNLRHPGVFEQRAKETTIFSGQNPTRLEYYKPEWSTAQLLTVQTERTLGLFNQTDDNGGFWPTKRPITNGLLSVLILLGMGWTCTRWRDPRFVLLALWFWVGITGVIVTVETPNVQRLASAIPTLAIFPALVLDSLVRRVEATFSGNERTVRSARWATGIVTLVAVAYIVGSQGVFYFSDYARMDGWPQPNVEGKAVSSQGAGTLVTTIGRQWHGINSGWIRLLAPFAQRGGIISPGSTLPLSVPANGDLAFLIYPRQDYYMPYLNSVYPGGITTPFDHPTEGTVVTVYRIPKDKWADFQGAVAVSSQGVSARVSKLGEPLRGLARYPSPMHWYATLRVSQYWNYAFRIGPGLARLVIDGKEVLTVSEGESTEEAVVSLARGDHFIELDAQVPDANHPATFLWAQEPERASGQAPNQFGWQQPRAEELSVNLTATHGLFGVIQVSNPPDRPEIHQIDHTLATDGVSHQIGIIYPADVKYAANWTGTLLAPATGTYSMTLYSQGVVEMRIDDKQVIYQEATSEQTTGGEVELLAGAHEISVEYKVENSPGGIEWTWIPPDGVKSIVPPSVLVPAPGAGVGDPVSQSELGNRDSQPVEEQLRTVP